MSDPPISTLVGQDIYDAVEPLTYADEQLGWPLAIFVDSLGLMLDEEAQLVRDDDDGNVGWSAFADPLRVPTSYLFTLAQWAGVRYPRRMPEADLRQMIGPHGPGLWRGTRAAILAGVQRYLSPDGALYFEERADGDPYKIRIFTYVYDTLDETAIRRELVGLIPAGLIVSYDVRVGQSYKMAHDAVASYAAFKAKWPTYAAVKAAI